MKVVKVFPNRFKFWHLVALILILSFALRLSYYLIFPGGLSLDARSYYTAAINIANGNGYSDHTEAPFLPFYFREPVTSYSMSFFVWLWQLFSGVDVVSYPTSWVVSDMDYTHQSIILLIRIWSCLLQLSGLLLFSSVVKRHSTKTAALVFLAIGAISMPLIIYSSLLLREVYLFFFLMLVTWLWDSFLISGKWLFLIASALTCGIICLCLHLYWILLLIFIPFLVIHIRRNKQKAFVRCLVFVLIFFLPVIPWVCRVYNYYPDIRIVRTLGSGLTADYTNALNAYRAFGVDPYYAKQGDLPRDIPVRTDIFSVNDVRNNFKYTFDGTYRKEASRINAENTSHVLWCYYLDRIWTAFHNTVFIVGITYDYGVFKGYLSVIDIAKFLCCLPWLFMGLIALFGLVPMIKRYWMIMPVFFYNTLLFFAFGDEERRQYVLIPWIIIICMYAIYYYFFHERKK